MAPICPTAFWNTATSWSQTLPLTRFVSLLAGGSLSTSPLQGWLPSLLSQCSHSSSTETSGPYARAPSFGATCHKVLQVVSNTHRAFPRYAWKVKMHPRARMPVLVLSAITCFLGQGARAQLASISPAIIAGEYLSCVSFTKLGSRSNGLLITKGLGKYKSGDRRHEQPGAHLGTGFGLHGGHGPSCGRFADHAGRSLVSLLLRHMWIWPVGEIGESSKCQTVVGSGI